MRLNSEGEIYADGLVVRIKAAVTYRVKKIEVKSSDAIDQLKIIYDDDSICSIGHNGGKTDKRAIIMTNGEYLVRVTHERFANFKCAGAAIEFETNKGRVFSYKPVNMATTWKTEQTTINACHGKEIVSLIIRHGILIGSEQQAAPPSEIGGHLKSWYAIGYHREKSNDDSPETQNVKFKHFNCYDEALKSWKNLTLEIDGKTGRGAIFVDCMKLKVIKSSGALESVNVCRDQAIDAGFNTHKDEKDLSMFDVLLTLILLLKKSKDIWTFLLVISLLYISFYLNLETHVLSGYVITLVTSNQSEIKNNWYARKSCEYIMRCDGSTTDLCKGLVISLILVKVLEMFFYALNLYFHYNASDTKKHQLRCDAFKHVISLDQSYFDTHTLSDIRGSMNVHAISNLISWNIPYLSMYIISFAMTAYYLVSIDIYLGSFCIVFMIAIKFGLIDPITNIEKQVLTLHRKLDAVNTQICDDVLNMIGTVKMFSKEQYHIDEHEIYQKRVMKNVNSVVVLACVREFFYGISKVVLFSLVVYCGLQYINESKLSPGALTGFFLLLQKFQYLFGRIKVHYELLIREFPDIERFITLMQEKPTITNGAMKPQNINGEIEFQNVTFAYPLRPGNNVLKDFNLTIQAHKTTAIVGDSGAGKSTVAKLLMHLYEPNSGSIKVDGYDLRDLDRNHLSKFIGIVNQNPELFNLSLADNIGYGTSASSSSHDQVVKSSQLANCGFISKFRSGFDTFAGSSGSQLSGGEKQRIAIARAIIRNPTILILDEATSSLDTENEVLVQKALEKVMNNRTTLVIAHRLSTIRNADVIICMEDGLVAERGTHDELMERRGTYYRLVSKQIIEEKEKTKKQQ